MGSECRPPLARNSAPQSALWSGGPGVSARRPSDRLTGGARAERSRPAHNAASRGVRRSLIRRQPSAPRRAYRRPITGQTCNARSAARADPDRGGLLRLSRLGRSLGNAGSRSGAGHRRRSAAGPSPPGGNGGQGRQQRVAVADSEHVTFHDWLHTCHVSCSAQEVSTVARA